MKWWWSCILYHNTLIWLNNTNRFCCADIVKYIFAENIENIGKVFFLLKNANHISKYLVYFSAKSSVIVSVLAERVWVRDDVEYSRVFKESSWLLLLSFLIFVVFFKYPYSHVLYSYIYNLYIYCCLFMFRESLLLFFVISVFFLVFLII